MEILRNAFAEISVVNKTCLRRNQNFFHVWITNCQVQYIAIHYLCLLVIKIFYSWLESYSPFMQDSEEFKQLSPTYFLLPVDNPRHKNKTLTCHQHIKHCSVLVCVLYMYMITAMHIIFCLVCQSQT